MSETEKKPELPLHPEEELFFLTEEMKAAMAEAGEKAKLLEHIENPDQEIPNNFREYNQDQNFFITVSKQGFVEENSPAAVIDAIIERLDLSQLYKTYSEEGNKAYHPKMMLKILFYAYFCRLMSSRTIWQNVINRCDFIFLAAGQVPNFRTINAFRLRHLKDLSHLFAQILLLCRELDMIGFEHLSIDGEKIAANANYRRSKNLAQVKSELQRLEKGMKKLIEQPVNECVTKDQIENRLETLEKKINSLGELQKQLEQINDEKKRLNMSDADAAVMKLKDARVRPCYNHQTARDGKYGVVTAVETTQAADVPEDLLPLVEQSVTNTLAHHKIITADSGFQSYGNLEKMAKRPENFFIPDKMFERVEKKEKKFGHELFERNTDGSYRCPAGRTMKKRQTAKAPDGGPVIIYESEGCWNCIIKGKCTDAETRLISFDAREPLRDRMREKLRSDEGRQIYMKRQGLSEPIHGDDQKNGGWVQHLLRSLEKARAEFVLIRLANNLRCMVKHRSKMILAWN
jgi:transposase